MKLIKAVINSNIYISLAAVGLTFESQIMLGIRPQWHPYLFIIFFATLLEYNLTRFITILINKEALNSENQRWVRENLMFFYGLIFVAAAGLIGAAFMAMKEVLVVLAPIALITLFYSVPVSGNRKSIFSLREIPYLKIFLIALVWSSSTIFLPIIQSNGEFKSSNILAMVMERFFFVFAITIPFDIRDIEADKQAGLKTIPLFLDENKSYILSYLSLLIFMLISVFQYQRLNHWYIFWALAISASTTFLFLSFKRIRRFTYYHYGILDGTMLLQGGLIFAFYLINIS